MAIRQQMEALLFLKKKQQKTFGPFRAGLSG
jgi:hypothetical protein